MTYRYIWMVYSIPSTFLDIALQCSNSTVLLFHDDMLHSVMCFRLTANWFSWKGHRTAWYNEGKHLPPWWHYWPRPPQRLSTKSKNISINAMHSLITNTYFVCPMDQSSRIPGQNNGLVLPKAGTYSRDVRATTHLLHPLKVIHPDKVYRETVISFRYLLPQRGSSYEMSGKQV